MRTAPTKADVQMVATLAVKHIAKNSLPEDRDLLAMHLTDAKRRYEKTDEYRKKAGSLLEMKDKNAKNKQKINPESVLSSLSGL